MPGMAKAKMLSLNLTGTCIFSNKKYSVSNKTAGYLIVGLVVDS